MVVVVEVVAVVLLLLLLQAAALRAGVGATVSHRADALLTRGDNLPELRRVRIRHL